MVIYVLQKFTRDDYWLNHGVTVSLEEADAWTKAGFADGNRKYQEFNLEIV